jgi:hypothetical protein
MTAPRPGRREAQAAACRRAADTGTSGEQGAVTGTGPTARHPARNTAKPSRELSVGDAVGAGEAGLTVGRAGWTLVRGGLNEVRTSEHGTRPLPPPTLGGATPGGPSPIPRKEPDRP